MFCNIQGNFKKCWFNCTDDNINLKETLVDTCDNILRDCENT